MRIFNKILMFTLVIVVVFSSVTRPAFAKYTGSYSGLASHTWFTTKIVTDVFRITNTDFVNKDEVTSDSLHGVGMGLVDDVLTVNPTQDQIDENDVSSLASKVFTVQNSSDYDLVACFDIIICLGALNDVSVVCKITEQSSGTVLKVTAKQVGTADIPLTLHRESESDTTEGADADAEIIKVDITNSVGGRPVDYKAYSTHVDPTIFIDDSATVSVEDNKITTAEFDAFILVKSGETKMFTLETDVQSSIWDTIGGFIGGMVGIKDKNCYASMTMTVKKYERPTT